MTSRKLCRYTKFRPFHSWLVVELRVVSVRRACGLFTTLLPHNQKIIFFPEKVFLVHNFWSSSTTNIQSVSLWVHLKVVLCNRQPVMIQSGSQSKSFVYNPIDRLIDESIDWFAIVVKWQLVGFKVHFREL